MKNTTLLAIGLSLASVTAFADEPSKIEITSFYYTGAGRTAEACGKVTGPITPHTRVTLTVDPGGNPGTYVTVPDSTGLWCSLVNSQIGKVQATLWESHHAERVAAAEATASPASTR